MIDKLREYHGREEVKQPSGMGGGGGGGQQKGQSGQSGLPQRARKALDERLQDQEFGEKVTAPPEEEELAYEELEDTDELGPDKDFYGSTFEWSSSDKSMFKLADAFAMDQEETGQRAMEKARSMAYNVGATNGGPRAPIKPMGVATRKAINIAQAMIERLSTVDDDERVQQDEFLYDTKRLMKLDINPMRGIRSAKVGRSKAPVAIFVDYSGSCNHVSDLFGTIMVGFANEGATILIGGNGTVESVYHPFPNRPLADYAEDAQTVVTRRKYDSRVKVKAGYLVACGSTGLSKFKLKALIACTDSHSQQELLARKAFDTHVVYAVPAEHHHIFRNEMRDGKMTEQAAEAGGDFKFIYDLGFHQHVHVVSDLETLTEALQTGR